MLHFLNLRMLIWLAILSLFPISFVALSVWAGWELAIPQRRLLQNYHLEILKHPQRHGLRLVNFTLSDQTPCLFCEPAGTPGKRGILIREQVTSRGIALADFGEIGGTLVLLHGRKGRKEDYLPIAERLCACGFRCLIPDLPGHGDHPVALVTYGVRESELPGRVLSEASKLFGFPEQPVGLLGMSMGGSVAIHAAAHKTIPWRALVIISSFDSLAPILHGNVSRHFGPWIGPTISQGASWVYQQRSGLSLENISPVDLVALLGIPTLVTHGTSDTVIPVQAGRRLFESLPVRIEKQWIEVPEADHHNVLITDFPLYGEIATWMLKHVAAPLDPSSP